MEHDALPGLRPERLLGLAARRLDDPIVAISTAAGRGAVGIVRVSGPPKAVAAALTGVGVEAADLIDRRATRVTLRDGNGVLDRGLAIRFVAPRSYTGDEVVELQLHGNPALLDACVDRLVGAGARLADPGEFTRRALANGRLTLLQAEAVDAVVRAEGLAAAKLAQRHLGGELAGRLDAWRAELLAAAAALEALVDYPEEIEPDEAAEPLSELPRLRDELVGLRDRSEATRGALRSARAVLVGPVNAGKSTLFNRLLGHERAIVSDEAGTTRDVVSESFEIDGRAVRLEDTAGRREAAGSIEAQGVERSLAAEARADVVVQVRDGRAVVSGAEDVGPQLPLAPVEFAAAADARGSSLGEPPGAEIATPSLWVATHRDQLAPGEVDSLESAGWTVVGPTSDLDPLRHRLAPTSVDGLALHTARQRASLGAALESLDGGLAAGAGEPVLMALALRDAGRALEELGGAWSDEAVLDELFSRFCLGK